MTNEAKMLEIMISLMKMYDNGELDNEYDETSDEMIPSEELEDLMEMARELLPAQLEGNEAAERMRDLSEIERQEAIMSSGRKVADLRREFQIKMSENGGARGLLEQLVSAKEANDTDAESEVIENILEFIHGPEE